MKLIALLDQGWTSVVAEWRAMTKAVPAFLHAVAEFAQSAPTNVWAMCAFAAAASIMVTLVTLYLWPKEKTAASVADHEPGAGATAVWRLASTGHGTAEIVRRTGLSHDAVATILRRPTRKSRPTAA
jgi:hypothetical protein